MQTNNIRTRSQLNIQKTKRIKLQLNAARLRVTLYRTEVNRYYSLCTIMNPACHCQQQTLKSAERTTLASF